jgi:hypothetical protein
MKHGFIVPKMQRASQPREVTRYSRFQTPVVYEQESHKRVVKCITSLLLPFSPSYSLVLSIHALNLTAVRLIRSPTLRMPTRLERRRSLQLVTLLAKRRGRNALIRIRCLLNNHLLVRALARAAAHAKRPEETGGNAESDTDPHCLQHLVAH